MSFHLSCGNLQQSDWCLVRKWPNLTVSCSTSSRMIWKYKRWQKFTNLFPKNCPRKYSNTALYTSRSKGQTPDCKISLSVLMKFTDLLQKNNNPKTNLVSTQIQFCTFLSSEEWPLPLLNWQNSIYWWKKSDVWWVTITWFFSVSWMLPPLGCLHAGLNPFVLGLPGHEINHSLMAASGQWSESQVVCSWCWEELCGPVVPVCTRVFRRPRWTKALQTEFNAQSVRWSQCSHWVPFFSSSLSLVLLIWCNTASLPSVTVIAQ